MKKRAIFFILSLLVGCIGYAQEKGVWPEEKANAWYKGYKWLSGCDYIPCNAINQLEMWQKDTYDPAEIDKEFGWAENLGFNTMRVFLHSLAWKEDPSGFKKRMDSFLKIADKHKIKILFVFFDDCWNKEAGISRQPAPKPGIHNSGWVQDPGDPAYKETSNYPELEKYVKDILKTFSKDDRILMWDLYNEPGNSGKGDTTLPLLKAIFIWAREVNPSQPLTSGIWDLNSENLTSFQIHHSDVITYHNYSEPAEHLTEIQLLKSFGRPVICTEYMARTRNSRFYNIMPLLKKEGVGAINWGFVTGKTNTKYAWDTPLPDGREPDEWFHDILNPDGTPYSEGEINVIKRLNEK